MKLRSSRLLIVAGWLIATLAVSSQAGRQTDTDRDGLPDNVEELLGTDPNMAEPFKTIQTHKVRAAGPKDAQLPAHYTPGLDIKSLAYAPIAPGRHAWRIEFAAPFQADNAMIIIYLNTDNDKKTGRQDIAGGIDVMLTYSGGHSQARLIDATGLSTYTPHARSAIVDGGLVICADIPISQIDAHTVFDVRLLAETRKPHKGVDSTPWTHVLADPEPKREPPPCLLANWPTTGLIAIGGIRRIERIKADPANLVIPMSDWKLDGFTQDIRSEYRESSVVRSSSTGMVTASVPKPGKWHVGLVLYDDGSDDRLEVVVNGRRRGILVGDWNDNRQYLYLTDKPIDLKAGDSIVLRTIAPWGRYRIETLMLLASKPDARHRRFDIQRPAVTIPSDTDATRAEITWTTTWPTRGRVEFGATVSLGHAVQESGEWNNHRVRLSDLKPGSTVNYRIVCQRPDGASVSTDVKTFAAASPPLPKTRAVQERLSLMLTGADRVPVGWPVTGGVPMPRGSLASADNVRLVDESGHELPLQVVVTSRWDDGSIRWLLLDFATTQPPGKAYVLEYGREVRRTSIRFAKPLRVTSDANAVVVDTGTIRVPIDRHRFTPFLGTTIGGRTLPMRSDSAGAVLIDEKGRSFTTLGPPDSIEVEERGPLRAVVRVRGKFTCGEESLFRYDARLAFYQGLPFARMTFTFVNDNTRSLFTEIDSLSVRLPLSATSRQAVAAYDDKKPRHQGRVLCRDGAGVAVREFWQNWPKTLSVDDGGAEIGICPKFDKSRVPKDGTDRHRLYYYLQTGRYKLKAGVSRRHEILVSLGPGKGVGDFSTRASVFENPPILTAPPEWYADTKVFGDIGGPEPVVLKQYDRAFAKAFATYMACRENHRAYGMLNFGDWWGERGINWGNIEYDTQHAFLIQWARSGVPGYFRAGLQAANHHMDVDLIRHGTRPDLVGRVYAHCIGHTGNYYRTSPVKGKGSTGGYLSVSHTWVEGFLDDYFLTGDRRALEAAEMIAARYDSYGTLNYDFTNCRVPGWHLILSMAMYRATRDPYHLNACHIIMDRVLERQTPEGGWRRQMVPGHCRHLPRCHGNAGFMISVLMTGMRWYHQETGDPRVLDSIHRAAKFVVKDMWVDKVKGFRYTSCRETSAGVWANFMASDGLSYAARLKRDPQLADIVRIGIAASMANGIPGSGKSISQATRVMPHTLYHLDALEKIMPSKGE